MLIVEAQGNPVHRAVANDPLLVQVPDGQAVAVIGPAVGEGEIVLLPVRGPVDHVEPVGIVAAQRVDSRGRILRDGSGELRCIQHVRKPRDRRCGRAAVVLEPGALRPFPRLRRD